MEESKPELLCDGPGCDGIGTKFCSRCSKVAYCSADCQRKAWPTHKLVCQKADSAENAVRDLLKQGKLYSARSKLRQLPKQNAKLEAELEEMISMGIYSEILNGAIRLESGLELGQGYVATRDLAPEEELLFDTAFLTAPADAPKAPHFLMAEQVAKRFAGGSRRKSAKKDVQADFLYNHILTVLPLKGGMERSAIQTAAMEDEVREQMLICSIAEGSALYCTEETGQHMALYPAAAFFNHSCAPNARIESNRSTLVVKAAAPIRKGEEIFLSYLPPAILEESGEKRRERLDGGRGFDCACARCRAEREGEGPAPEAQEAPEAPEVPCAVEVD